MKIIFMGTPGFAVPALEVLFTVPEYKVIAVYTQPPRPAGRGQKEQRSSVHEKALECQVPVYTPQSFKEEAHIQQFAQLKADIAVVAAYGLLLPKSILESPRYGCINIHASLLPRWRGAAPIQRAILAGDNETGITIMQMDEGLDTGDMLASDSTQITGATTTTSLHNTLTTMGASLMLETLEAIAAGKAKPTPQPTEGVTYAKKLTKEESIINWEEPALIIHRQIRAFNPWPSTYFTYKGEKIRICEAEYINQNTDKAPGTVLDDTLTIACGTDCIRPTIIQRPSRKISYTEDMLRGFPILEGEILS